MFKTIEPLEITATRATDTARYGWYIAPMVWILWSVVMSWQGLWHVLFDHWFMTLTMCVGSFIAGATSEGGGAVAFPAMTLLYDIRPSIARDFSLMIQAVGMSSAAAFIILRRIRVAWQAILYAGLGGTLGIVFSLSVLAPVVSAIHVKLFFTSLWLSFGVALFAINRHPNRYVAGDLAQVDRGLAWQLFAIGIPGGIVSGLTGSGLDILTFTFLTLHLRLNERVATPTSVILMASNAIVGFAWMLLVRGDIAPVTWEYWMACIPVVVCGAPLGAYFISRRTRHFVAHLLYASILAQFIGALLILPLTPSLVLFSATTVAAGLALFGIMAMTSSITRDNS